MTISSPFKLFIKVAVVWVLMYLTGVFANADINLKEWESFSRGILAGIGLVGTFVVVLMEA